ncbi:DUF349 domain-containing protein [Muribaculaceae bacterium Isolate-002 (NCI)]|nr:DUF349 domain-containing protein [Muribaculaceae bacterium Isolate-002 (NCI)]
METRQMADEPIDLTANPIAENSQPQTENEEVNTSAVAADAATDETKAPEAASAIDEMSEADVIITLTSLAQAEADEISRDEVSRLKQRYYALRKATDEEARRQFVANGNDPEAFIPEEDPADEVLRQLLGSIKEKKAARAAEVEAELQRNFEQKDSLIAEITAMSNDTDNVNRHFTRFREIQQEFKNVGDVSPQQMSDQWKRYQDAVELFYDQLKVNKDLRDYDFKKNLETKLQLCAEAEKLDAEADVIAAFKRLQDLHVTWRETGPVAKEQREEIWARFKEASAVVNKKYQAFFEERKAREQENEAAKTAICERLEALDFDSLKSFNAWNDMTRTILQAQEDWRKLGFASKKANNLLFTRFRAVCDKFFAQKAEYYKSVKEDMTANLEKKLALCEQAEALKDSTDWKATAEKLTELQRRWKTIGSVPKKRSDEVWKRFQEACDYFFEQKKRDLSQSRKSEQENLRAKRALTASLKEIAPDAPRQQVVAAIKDAQARWNEIGHVPFREKDKVYDEFRSVINELYKVHDLKDTRANFARFENSINEMSDSGKLIRERERLARVLETKRSELTTYQNNLGFFNFKSTSGSSMLRDIERKTQRIRDDIADLEKKIALIDGRL